MPSVHCLAGRPFLVVVQRIVQALVRLLVHTQWVAVEDGRWPDSLGLDLVERDPLLGHQLDRSEPELGRVLQQPCVGYLLPSCVPSTPCESP